MNSTNTAYVVTTGNGLKWTFRKLKPLYFAMRKEYKQYIMFAAYGKRSSIVPTKVLDSYDTIARHFRKTDVMQLEGKRHSNKHVEPFTIFKVIMQ